MLQFCFRFFLTTMSTFGVRLQLLRSDMVRRLLKNIVSFPHRLTASLVFQRRRQSIGLARIADILRGPRFEVPWAVKTLGEHLSTLALCGWDSTVSTMQFNLAVLTFLKPNSLAWSGVLWRSWILGVLAGLNVVFWFAGVKPSAFEQDGCLPTVFMFSPQPLHSASLTFFRTGAVAAAIFIFPLAGSLLLLSSRLFRFFCMCVQRDFSFGRNSDTQEKLRKAFEKVVAGWKPQYGPVNIRSAPLFVSNPFLRHGDAAQANFVFNLFSPFRTWTNLIEFFLSSGVEDIRATDILQLCAGLSSGSMQVERHDQAPVPVVEDENRTGNNEATHSGSVLAKAADRIMVAWNILKLLTIVWFISSIELTIRWNRIRGVDSIQSTGQLIPFIVGITSMAQALQTVVVNIIKGCIRTGPILSSLQIRTCRATPLSRSSREMRIAPTLLPKSKHQTRRYDA
ncbi:hypothetical protein NLU13_7773 [Sarocladium strictum]|uniref:Transmembrane protein n=1 Tax=Sarocladium strictum TaxID=5046 RepID=A0AA39GDF5_SARSR|nr:hypothetical protein NLU13_7773 [Sarocladium strictum]